MKTVLLVCTQGMSTSFLTNKINTVAKENNVPIHFYAKSENQIELELDRVDCILLGPQVAYMEKEICDRVKGRVPVEAIDAANFGRMNAVAILKQAIRLIKSHNQG